MIRKDEGFKHGNIRCLALNVGAWWWACRVRKWHQAGFSKRVGMGLLTKFCKRPHPRTAVFGIRARCYGAVVVSGVVLPVRAREGRLKTGVRRLRDIRFFEVGGDSS